MYKTWVSSGEIVTLARELEAHLNEFAAEVVSVSYAVTDSHHVLAVYKLVEPSTSGQEVAVSAAEQIIEEALY
jgi:hypothetical protein